MKAALDATKISLAKIKPLWFLVIISLLCAGLILQAKVSFNKRRESTNITSYKVDRLMGHHYNKMYDVHTATEKILAGDKEVTAAEIIPLLRYIDQSRISYDAALLFADGTFTTYISLLFYRYDAAISDFLFGNLLGDNSRTIEREEFISVIKDVELFSSWVLNEFGMGTGEIYREADLKGSAIFDSLSVKPSDY